MRREIWDGGGLQSEAKPRESIGMVGRWAALPPLSRPPSSDGRVRGSSSGGKPELVECSGHADGQGEVKASTSSLKAQGLG